MSFIYGIIRTVFLSLTLYTVSCGAPVWLQYLAICLSSLAWATTAHLEALRADR